MSEKTDKYREYKSQLGKVDQFKTMLNTSINMMCLTDNKDELEDIYDSSIRHIRNIRSINYDRLLDKEKCNGSKNISD